MVLNSRNKFAKLIALLIISVSIFASDTRAGEHDLQISPELKKQAADGDALANYKLGLAYFNRSTRKDRENALKYFLAARKAYANGPEETRV